MVERELSFTVSAGTKEGTVILALDGPFTLSNLFQIQSEFRSLRPPCLIVDMSLVPYMDSAGLGVIMNSFVSAQSAGRTFILAGVSDRLRALFEMTKVDSVLRICDSVDSAQSLA